MKNKGNLISSVLTILMGILFCVLKEGVIDIMMTVLGVLLIVGGVLALLTGDSIYGIVLIILGVVVIVFGWAIKEVIFYIIAALLILVGIAQLIGFSKQNIKGVNPIITLFIYMVPVVRIVIGVLLFFNQHGTISWVMYVTGILLIVDGILGIAVDLIKK